MKRRPNQCHANVRWYVGNDPEGLSQAVSGWKVSETRTDYVLHSVVLQDGVYMCVTPDPDDQSSFSFIPDDQIVWGEGGDVFVPTRDGHEIGVGVRRYPALTQGLNALFRDKLDRGLAIRDAMTIAPDEWRALVQAHVPVGDWATEQES
jgi:hypothetical protein